MLKNLFESLNFPYIKGEMMTKKKQNNMSNSMTFNILLRGAVTYLRAKENIDRMKRDFTKRTIKPLMAFKSKISKEARESIKAKREGTRP
ncbi:hypothetical protein A9Q84_15505 [Halobacteriovorax marinus]|uniref:Uncharacterized protein n=1 Tax=Halobacteriovorax marinus TaxID=97084 RepID=A0A1Y5F3V7_9BACT|nr:hypothetical protein A9Q84_15505 [Halobacteriovorax marinus]